MARPKRATRVPVEVPEVIPHQHIERIDRSPIEPKNDNQRRYINAIKSSQLVFASGPAGVGKTWICTALACQELEAKRAERIIITRPAVEAGESLGFLPGELDEKYAPYLMPFMATFHERLGRTFTEYCLKAGKIEALPLAYMRGLSFKNSIILLDEAQNVTPVQMKMFLTRIGENCKVVVNGDLEQKDIPGLSGFEDAIRRTAFLSAVRHVKFDLNDVVRSDLVAQILRAYAT